MKDTNKPKEKTQPEHKKQNQTFFTCEGCSFL